MPQNGDVMHVGMIGLGRMGGKIVRRRLRGGHRGGGDAAQWNNPRGT
jgi:3-hydroxyisobutyrate dehydrogenase-like beta-hydroxyacid dehydrogenase